MEIGIGLPSTIPGVQGHDILDWAKRADRAGFSSLGTLGRVTYPNYEPLIARADGGPRPALRGDNRGVQATVGRRRARRRGRRGPGRERPPQLITGGQADVAFRRAAELGDGYMVGGGPPDYFPGVVERLEAAWREAGRDGNPRKLSLTYFAPRRRPRGRHRRLDRPLLRVRRRVQELRLRARQRTRRRSASACKVSRTRAAKS